VDEKGPLVRVSTLCSLPRFDTGWVTGWTPSPGTDGQEAEMELVDRGKRH